MDDMAKIDENDHRHLGKELDLFVFSDLVGAGLPLWTPRGTTVRDELDKFVKELRGAHGFQTVTIPHITKSDLYKKSGHWTKFSDDLFKITSRDKHEFVIKPMNCPHHTQIYASRPRSYRDLPIRYQETTMNYRDEQTGELNGILRTRAFTQDDCHVFCREDQVVEEAVKLWQVIQQFYAAFGHYSLSLRLSRRDPKTPKAYAGDSKLWERAEAELQDVIAQQKDMKVEEEGIGEAAFYGPKLDFMGKDANGKQWQVATIQVDFAQPEGLDLTYVDSDGSEKRPVMIHCAVMGSIERFLAVYLDMFGGSFPVWLAPEQIRLLTVNQEKNITEFAAKVVEQGKELGLRMMLDDSNESVGKKIRDAEVMKVPYVVVIGEKELENGKVVPRVRSDMEVQTPHQAHSVETFLKTVANEAKSRVSKTSL